MDKGYLISLRRLEIKICKSDRPLKLVHTSLTTYFETLRNKLLWGIDLRIKKD